MAVNMPRVLGLLDEIIAQLVKLRKDVSKNNPELAGVFDRLIIFIEAQKLELQEERPSFEHLFLLIKFVVDLIDIIHKWPDTLYYKVGRYLATFKNIKWRKQWQLGKISNYSGLMLI